jgi:hypothetical protein
MEVNLKSFILSHYHFDKLIETGMFYDVIIHEADRNYFLKLVKEDCDRIFGEEINEYLGERGVTTLDFKRYWITKPKIDNIKK